MDLKQLKKRIEPIFGKYKYTILILVIGIVLMLIPGTVSTGISKKNQQPVAITATGQTDIQMELETILGCIWGAGDVKVMLKEATGAETVYQSNEDHTDSENSTTTRTDVITITDSNRGEYGLIRQVNPPKYMGAIILCQGADDPTVRLAVVDAVSKITGLGSDKIAVLKMK